MYKDTREILKDGSLSGREKDTKRKARKELEKLKDLPLLENKKPRMFLRPMPVLVPNKSQKMQLRKENDRFKWIKF